MAVALSGVGIMIWSIGFICHKTWVVIADWVVEVDKESSMSIVLRSSHELYLSQYTHHMVHSYGTKYGSVEPMCMPQKVVCHVISIAQQYDGYRHTMARQLRASEAGDL